MEKIIIYETNKMIGWSNSTLRQTQGEELKEKIKRFLFIDVYDETIEGMVDLGDDELCRALFCILDNDPQTIHTN